MVFRLALRAMPTRKPRAGAIEPNQQEETTSYWMLISNGTVSQLSKAGEIFPGFSFSRSIGGQRTVQGLQQIKAIQLRGRAHGGIQPVGVFQAHPVGREGAQRSEDGHSQKHPPFCMTP